MRRLRLTAERPVMFESINMLSLRTSAIDSGNYLIGLSGGADSTALLLMLIPSIRDRKIRVEVIHVNHGLRASESDGDEQFCRELCQSIGVELTVCNADLAGRKDEAAARDARYAAFRQRYTEIGADGLILAHNADDQAETYLMRLMRGTGPEGLACMKADETVAGIRIMRPMLSLRRQEIRCALQADGIPWREDSTNEDISYLRNRIRQELIPAMTRISGTAVEKICSAAAFANEDNCALNAIAREILGRIADGWILDADALVKEPIAVRKRTLRIWWQETGPAMKEHALSAAQTESLERLLHITRGKINLPGNIHAIRDRKHLFLTGIAVPAPEPVMISGPVTVFGSYQLKETGSEGDPGDGKTMQEVPAGFTRGCVIRTRQPGDRIRPFGSSGSRKLQDYLTDRQIAEPFRDRIPLLCRGREVFLVCGVGAGDIPHWSPDTPSVRLTWYGKIPWKE